MSSYIDSFANRFIDILNYPLMHRCPELGILIDRCSIKELQDVFPILINSIFGGNGGVGWGFRTVCHDINQHEFDILYNFFIPMGPMFRLCYRLLNDAYKFEVPIEYLPIKLRQMLENGRYATFYSDLVNINPFKREIVSLSLNAFDYYILHFAIHGMVPLHKMSPCALAIHNEKWKTVYFILTADYLCSFLPSHPDAVVQPYNISGTVKSLPTMPMQPIQPQLSPKYISLSALSHCAISPSSLSPRTAEAPRNLAWRTESVLYLFIDTWLRYDIDETRELPSIEFIRVVRILVKQLHSFINATDLDTTPIAGLRKQAAPMMNSRVYQFLKSIMSRWPLDSSFSVVLELWLSYLQPWRYSFERDISFATEIPIAAKHELFISENLASYTQIFIQILSRFMRLDLSTFRNVLMLYRIVKVFGQTNLIDIIRSYEMSLGGHTINDRTPTSNRSATLHLHQIALLADMSNGGANGSGNDTRFHSLGGSLMRTEPFVDDESYVFLFSPSNIEQLESLARKIHISKSIALQYIHETEKELEQRYKGSILKYLKWFFVDDHDLANQSLNDSKKIPIILDVVADSIGRMFGICSAEELFADNDVEMVEATASQLYANTYLREKQWEGGGYLNISPTEMKRRALHLRYTGDPALMPVTSYEFLFLVRFLHQVSCKLNIMFSDDLRQYWYRTDLRGRIARQVLSPPMTAVIFDKSRGEQSMYEETLGPRICLRNLASFGPLLVVVLSFIIGLLLFRVPSYGFLLLLLIIFVYILLLSVFNDVPLH